MLLAKNGNDVNLTHDHKFLCAARNYCDVVDSSYELL